MTAFVISNAGGNWNAAASYVAGVGFPVAGDTVTATGTSGNLTVNVASACASIILTNYVGTLTFNANLTLTSTCTFVAGMTVAGTAGTLICNGTATLTSGGQTLTGGLTLQGGVTYTLADNWTVNGLVTLGSTGVNTAVNGNILNCVAGLTHGGTTTNSVTGTTSVKMTGTGTWTSLAAAGSIQTPLTFVAGAGTITIGSARYSANTLTYTSGTFASGGSIVFGATVTVSGFSGSTAATGQLQCDISILVATAFTLTTAFNTTGTITVTNGTGSALFVGAFAIGCGGFTLTGGTSGTCTLVAALTATGALTLSNTASTTFIGNFAVTAGSLALSGTQTLTPASGQTITITGTSTISDDCVLNLSGASVFKTAGLTTTGNLTGTQLIRFDGSGTWSGAGACSNSVTINSSGTLTLSGKILYAASDTPTLTYTAGTVTAGTSIFSIGSSCTLATNGMSFANMTISAAATITLSSLLTVSNVFQLPNAAVTLAGAGDFSVGTLTTDTLSAARIYTFDSGNTYTINTAFLVAAFSAGHASFVASAVAGTKANIVLVVGAAQYLSFVDATDIDSSAGQTIYTASGTLVRAINWSVGSVTTTGLRAIGHAG